MANQSTENSLIIMINWAGVGIAYFLLALSLYLSTDVPLATKGYWGMAILLLTISLVNVVKYRFDTRSSEDRIRKIEDAKNEKMLEDLILDK